MISNNYPMIFFISKTCPCNIQRFLNLLKMKIFNRNFFIFFLIFAQNIDCGYTLEPPHRGSSNEYPQSMFWNKNKKICIPPIPQFCCIKVGFKGVYITRTCFHDEVNAHDLKLKHYPRGTI